MGNCCWGVSTVPAKIPTLEECVEYLPTDGIVVSVYDGDTFTLAVWNHELQKWTKWPVRVARVDCPELRTKNPSEKQIALKAKTFVEERVLHKRVQLKNVSREKYGRILADVFVSGESKSINELLIQHRLAVPYDGGTKHVPDDWAVWHERDRA